MRGPIKEHDPILIIFLAGLWAMGRANPIYKEKIRFEPDPLLTQPKRGSVHRCLCRGSSSSSSCSSPMASSSSSSVSFSFPPFPSHLPRPKPYHDLHLLPLAPLLSPLRLSSPLKASRSFSSRSSQVGTPPPPPSPCTTCLDSKMMGGFE